MIRSFVGRYLTPEDADDTVQEVLVRMFRRASEFDPRRDALSWVLGIAAFEVKAIQRKRYRRREVPIETGPDAPDTAADPEQSLLARDQEDWLRTALTTLPALDAETLMAVADGQPPPTVAPATFRKRVQRALGRLRVIVRTNHDRK